jgi:polysaccharide deacetylase 2 family uncharacterized protein YibQ
VSKRKKGSGRRRSKSAGRKQYHVLLIFLLLVSALFFLYEEFGTEDVQQAGRLETDIPEDVRKPEKPAPFPRVAVVIDDLGPNKRSFIELMNINSPFTLSVLPHETYTKWIAEEGHSLGYDVIGHIPMEASKPVDPGKGGLFTWMTDGEILETLADDLNAIPNIKGISNHMGSSFTQDERVMNLVISTLKEHGLFFLDSITSSGSAGYRIAREHGVKTIKRDIFLDSMDSSEFLEDQWEKLIQIARSKGHAVGIAHAREKTIDFFKKNLPTDKVAVVPLSELIEEGYDR